MSTFARETLSGSADGRGIKVAASATPGTTIHTGPSTASECDEVWLFAANSSTSAVNLVIEWGGTTDPDDLITVTLAPKSEGLVPVVPGLMLKGNATPLVVKAFGSAANVITIFGYVNAIA